MAEIKHVILHGRTNIYVGSVYIPPEGSLYVYDRMYEEIQQDILSFPEDSGVLLVGDYNARTNTCADFISSGGNNGEVADILSANNAAFHQIDELCTEILLTRYSMDKCHVNSHARDLLEFCKGAAFLLSMTAQEKIAVQVNLPAWTQRGLA